MDTYIYNAAMHCEPCILAQFGQDYIEPEMSDSSETPCGPYNSHFQESDAPDHCDQCGAFLENPLTSHGNEWVKLEMELHDTNRFNEADHRGWPMDVWREFYSYLWE